MGTQTPQTPRPDGPATQTAPGKPASRQPTDGVAGGDPNQDRKGGQDREEGQDLPKTGRDPSEPIGQDVSDDSRADDDDGFEDEDDDDDHAGTIELPEETREGDRADRSTPPASP